MTTEAGTGVEAGAGVDADVEKPPRAFGLFVTLLFLLVLTALEVGVVNVPVDRAARITALVGLGMTKGLLLLAVFMRIGRESRVLRLGIFVPLVLAPGFAVALMLDAAFRVMQR